MEVAKARRAPAYTVNVIRATKSTSAEVRTE
jgi:hypothetical protein